MTNAAATTPIVEFPVRLTPTLREAAQASISLYRTRKQHRTALQHLIADLRGRVAATRRVLEASDVEQPLLTPLYDNLLQQATLLDELERHR